MKKSLYLIMGLGKTGLSIARYLKRCNKLFVMFDTRLKPPFHKEFLAEFSEAILCLQHIPEDLFNEITEVILSPGVSLESMYVLKAKHCNLPIYGDVECLARELKSPVIAITGTNGKSTVTTLVGEMARAAGLNVAIAGNIGEPVLDKLASAHAYDLWVLELSSFQLDLIDSLQPIAATILNISPDHLDRHHTLDAYIEAKQKIYQNCGLAIYNHDDNYTKPWGDIPAISFGINSSNPESWGIVKENEKLYLAKGHHKLIATDSLLIKGVHNWVNALAACALAEAAGIEWSFLIQVLKSFSGLPHRCQRVRVLNEVEWINDSKGTNVGATVSAIKGIGGAMQGKIILIAGGQGKGADFRELTQPIADFVRSVVLIGEDADQIENDLSHIVPIKRAETLDAAVLLAKANAKPGDVVLLSPACASLDMFRDFNHRGELFTSFVNGL